MDKIAAFLKETGVFFLATADGAQPKLRPLGLFLEMDGKLLFGVGNYKDVCHQLQADPLCEIAAVKPDGHWLRYTGRAFFETDPKYAAAALEASPDLKNIYNEQTGYKMGTFTFKDVHAEFIPQMMGAETVLDF